MVIDKDQTTLVFLIRLVIICFEKSEIYLSINFSGRCGVGKIYIYCFNALEQRKIEFAISAEFQFRAIN